MTVLDIKGRELSAANLMNQDARARQQLLAEGFDEQLIGGYMPVIDYGGD